MDIQFFFDPDNQPRSREDVRIKQVGLFVHEEGERVTFGLELTPFLERPCIDVEITNADGQPAGMLSVIEQVTPNFSLILHLRDAERRDPYTLRTVIYYTTPETEPLKVDDQVVQFETAETGEHIFQFESGSSS
jgi:hypothetical protein